MLSFVASAIIRNAARRELINEGLIDFMSRSQLMAKQQFLHCPMSRNIFVLQIEEK